MSTLAIQVLAVALVAVHLRAPFRASVIVLVSSLFFIPGSILFPEAPVYLFVLRIGLWAAAAGLFVRAATGEIPPAALRPSRAFVALALFVAVAYLLGVAAGPFPSQSERAFELWLLLVDQLLFLWVATAAVRVLGVRLVAKTAAISVVGVACIAILERATSGSYAHWWFRHQEVFRLGGQPLESRGGERRVRATAEFALQFAWVLAFFLPLLSLMALRAKRYRLLALASPPVVMIAIVLTLTRSVFAGVAAGGLCLLLYARGDRRIIGAVAVAALAGGAIYLSSGAVRDPYQAADPESEAVRARRLTILTTELADRPWTGLGLDGAAQRGIDSTDSAVLATYAGTGAVGLAALAAAVAAAAFTLVGAGAGAGVRTAPYAGAVLGGIASATLAMFAFDSLSGPMASWSLWLLAALGVGLYEEAVAAREGPLRPRSVKLPPRRLILPAAGFVGGVAVFALAPSHVAAELRIFTLSPQYLTNTQSSSAEFVGRVIVKATCDAAEIALSPSRGVSLDCFDPLNAGPGTGLVRIEAPSRQALTAASATFEAVAVRVHGRTRINVSSLPERSRPTWARTAPLTGTILAAEAALLLPAARFRRRQPARSAGLPALRPG